MFGFLWLRSAAGLTSHDNKIPQNELWIKLGGDKGHGSFKLSLQLCNIKNPNSQKNTALIAMCKAGDSVANLHTVFGMYQEQLEELEGMELG